MSVLILDLVGISIRVVGKMGYAGAEVARFLGVTTSAVNCSANSEEIPKLNRYL